MKASYMMALCLLVAACACRESAQSGQRWKIERDRDEMTDKPRTVIKVLANSPNSKTVLGISCDPGRLVVVLQTGDMPEATNFLDFGSSLPHVSTTDVLMRFDSNPAISCTWEIASPSLLVEFESGIFELKDSPTLVKELLTANQLRLRYPTAGGGTSGVVTFDVTGLQKVLQKTPECKHPGLTGQPKPDNEYSAIHSIIAIKKAELFYAAIHPDVGFTSDLASLGSTAHSQIIDNNLASGRKSG